MKTQKKTSLILFHSFIILILLILNFPLLIAQSSPGMLEKYKKGGRNVILYDQRDIRQKVIFKASLSELDPGDWKEVVIIPDPEPQKCLTYEITESRFYLLLKMDNDTYEVGTGIFDVTLRIQIQAYNRLNNPIPSATKLCTLRVNASSATIVEPEQLAYFDYLSFVNNTNIDLQPVKFKVTIMYNNGNYSGDCSTINCSQRLNLEAFYTDKKKIDVFNKNSPNSPIIEKVHPHENDNIDLFYGNPLKFIWSKIPNVSMYDTIPNYQIQILRLYNIERNYINEPYNCKAIINWTKALIIETGSSFTEFSLILSEGKGFYIWRVRPIGNRYPGGVSDCRNWGVWSDHFFQESNPICQYNSGDIIDITEGDFPCGFYLSYPFDENINWIHKRLFSEGGDDGLRVEDQISFADNLLNIRQTQKRLPSQNVTIVQQSIYDYSCRSVINSLPVPLKFSENGITVDSAAIGYKHNLMLNSTELYSAKHFDANNTLYNPNQVTSGLLNEYYNGDDNFGPFINENYPIPTADGYPFSRTIYYSDGTGRVKEQSGVGSVQRIKTDSKGVHSRTVSTLYSSASDQEIVAIFGDEAPSNLDIHKIINIDQNKIKTITYQDATGKTLATCLSKSQCNYKDETNLEPLLLDLPTGENDPSNIKEPNYCAAIIDYVTDNKRITDNQFESTKRLSFYDCDNTVQINYRITPVNLNIDLCNSTNYNVYPKFDVELSLINLDNNTSVTLNQNTINYDGVSSLEILRNPSQLVLPPGTYEFKRNITINQDFKEALTNQFLTDFNSNINTFYNDITTKLAAMKNDPSKGVDDFYDHLTPESGWTHDLVGKFYFKNVSCCNQFTIPEIHCQDECPDDYNFEKYLFDKWGAKLGYREIVQVQTVDYLNRYFYSNGNMMTQTDMPNGTINLLIEHMVLGSPPDPENTTRKYEKCELWKCWKQVVEGYMQNAIEKNDQNEFITQGNFFKPNVYYELLEDFLRCTGKCLQGVSNHALGAPVGNDYGYGYIEYAHKYFKYIATGQNGANQCTDCENQYNIHPFNYNPPNPQVQDYCGYYYNEDQTEYTNHKKLELFYNMVKGYNNSQQDPPYMTEYVKEKLNHNIDNIENLRGALVIDCKTDCESKYNENRELITKMFHDDHKVVQGDYYDYNGAETHGSYDIDTNEVNCLAHLLVEYCKSQCNLTINGNTIGTESERTAYTNARTKKLEVALYNPSNNPSCPEGYTSITKDIILPSFPQGLVDALNLGLSNILAEEEYIGTDPNLYATIDEIKLHCNTLKGKFDDYFGGISNTLDRNTYDFLGLTNVWVNTYTCSTLEYQNPWYSGNCYLFTIPKFMFFPTGNTHMIYHCGQGSNPAYYEDYHFLLSYGDIYLHVWRSALPYYPNNPAETTDVLYLSRPQLPCSHNLCVKWADLETSGTNAQFQIESRDCKSDAIETIMADLDRQISKCLASKSAEIKNYIEDLVFNIDDYHEEYKITYTPSMIHHFTLYYYDRAGRLIKTVAPKGVKLSQTRDDEPDHDFKTLYDYNSLGQLILKKSPDEDAQTTYFYNPMGQLRFSQNSRQVLSNPGLYSFTNYDALGRVVETGEAQFTIPFQQMADENSDPIPSSKTMYIKTVYSDKYNPLPPPYNTGGLIPKEQRFLQNRVSYTLRDPDGQVNTNEDQVLTIYSYDPHGNVEWAIQKVNLGFYYDPEIPGYSQDIVSMTRYEYDLISGNVLKVFYNENRPDEFYHQYFYDEDNRLTKVKTSRHNEIWERDAQYSYYLHGPLKRIEIGEDSLQGIDYTYNINGWLKSINHSNVNHYDGTNGYNYDPGSDGYNSLHNHYVPDYFGMILNYYSGDFNHYNSPLNSPGGYFGERLMDHGLEPGPNKITNLYNGNIPALEYGFNNKVYSNLVGVANNTILGSTFKYDILNRLRLDNYHFTYNQEWQLPANGIYKSNYTYDPNGNIYNIFRNGPFLNGSSAMDDLTYSYYGDILSTKTNRLKMVDDNSIPTPNSIPTDIEKMNPMPQNNEQYTYDGSGNLISDFGENISDITWTADGKVLNLQKTEGESFHFVYDSRGNRVREDHSYLVSGQPHTKHTIYIRDANGEVMAIYEGESTINPRYNAFFAEWLIYGSKSHGRFARTKEPNPEPNSMMYDPTVLYNPVLLTGGPPTHTRKLSFKDYELKDHLGDVRLVFSDLKLRPAYGENAFRLDQREASNYYPFGMMMPGLHFSAPSFSSRFAFNGMMKDDCIKGLGNSYNTEFRMYDPRIGRWWSLDAIENEYESPYTGLGNNPICFIDLYGLSQTDPNTVTGPLPTNPDGSLDYEGSHFIPNPNTGKWEYGTRSTNTQGNKWTHEDDVKYYAQHPEEFQTVDLFYALGKGFVEGLIYNTTNGLVDLRPEPTTILNEKERDAATFTNDFVDVAAITSGVKSKGNIVEKQIDIDQFRAKTKAEIERYQTELAKAKEKYPKKAEKDENHHPHPKYLRGDPKQKTDRFNAAYHQAITNDFREKIKYGTYIPPADATKIATDVMRSVYRNKPLPPK